MRGPEGDTRLFQLDIVDQPQRIEVDGVFGEDRTVTLKPKLPQPVKKASMSTATQPETAVSHLPSISLSRSAKSRATRRLQSREDLAAREREMVVGSPNAGDLVLLDQGKAGSIDISQLRATEAVEQL